jgi:kumamolisin
MVLSSSYSAWHELPGTQKSVARGATIAEPSDPNEIVEVVVRVRRKHEIGAKPQPGRRMSRADHDREYGAKPADIDAVRSFASHFHLTVKEVTPAERILLLDGKISDLEKAFQVTLHQHRFPDGRHYRGRTGTIHVPAEIKDAVVGVFGLDDRPVAWPAIRFSRVSTAAAAAAAGGGSQTPGPITSFYPNALAKIYNFPTGVDGTGQKIGIVELGGGYVVADLAKYYQAAGVTHAPTFTVRPVKGGATNKPAPSNPHQPDIEVLLDMEVAGSVAPGAELFMYFVKGGNDAQVLLGISAAVHDNATDLSVMSLSFGGPEYDSTTMGSGPGTAAVSQYQNNVNDLFETAGHLGITVCVATGDSASAGEPQDWDGKAHAGFPASSPYALACGGTHIVTATPGKPAEEVWHPQANVGSGGGISRYYPVPDYQKNVVTQKAVNPPGPFVGRGIPDVCADAAQESGYKVLCDGVWYPDSTGGTPPIGGTSASTPLWAGLIALLNQCLQTRLGFVTPLLYKIGSPSNALLDVAKGNNGDYSAGRGWDACTGLGSPNGVELLSALKPLLP